VAELLGRLWPGSALLSWLLGWLAYRLLGPGMGGLLASVAVVLGAAALHQRPWRKLCVALGLPLAALVLRMPVPAWGWLALALGLLMLYPVHLWRDAPLFLTPADALRDLPQHVTLPTGAAVLDAGCGSGAGLRAWRSVFPTASLHGTEASPLLALWAAWRCPYAHIRRGDLWQDDWSAFQMVYLFQRPESMPAALSKARAELRPGAWLLSLDFPLPGCPARAEWSAGGRHSLFLYAAEDLN